MALCVKAKGAAAYVGSGLSGESAGHPQINK